MACDKVRQFIEKYCLIDFVVAGLIFLAGAGVEVFPYSDRSNPSFISDISSPARAETIPYIALFSFTYLFGSAVVFLLCFFFMTDASAFKALSSYIFCLSASFFSLTIIRRLAMRPRPDTISICGGNGTYAECSAVLSGFELVNQFHSFPSGHAAESMASGLFLSMFLCDVWRSSSPVTAAVKALPIVFSLIVGCSRIIDRAHRADDVVFGFIVGGFSAFFTYSTFRRSLKNNFELSSPKGLSNSRT